jgi:hypothetical protein
MTEQTHPADRTMLSYPDPGFRQTIYWFVAALIMVVIAVVYWKIQPRSYSGGPSLGVILGGFFGVACLISGLSDAAFVWYYRTFKAKVSFDADNLYIEPIGEDGTVIPLRDVDSVCLTSWMTSRNTRGAHYWYKIGFTRDGIPDHVKVAIYPRTKGNLPGFQQSVKNANPDARIRNWASSIDWFLRKCT